VLFDEAERFQDEDQMRQRLRYVGITRAMERLTLFMSG
jgi:DNA helicase IV